MLRRIFRCLERPDAAGLRAQDQWCEPEGHTAKYCYMPYGGHWGTWHYIHVDLEGPPSWVFKPFVDEQTMIGGKGRMIYKQHHQPAGAVIGSVWLCPMGSFKRVLSRGGAWENVNLGSKHPDEKDHDDEQSTQPKTEQRDESSEVSGGADQSTSGNGDDGEAVSEPGGERGPEDPVLEEPVINPDSLEEIEIEIPSEGEGVDANGSPVV